MEGPGALPDLVRSSDLHGRRAGSRHRGARTVAHPPWVPDIVIRFPRHRRPAGGGPPSTAVRHARLRPVRQAGPDLPFRDPSGHRGGLSRCRRGEPPVVADPRHRRHGGRGAPGPQSRGQLGRRDCRADTQQREHLFRADPIQCRAALPPRSSRSTATCGCSARPGHRDGGRDGHVQSCVRGRRRRDCRSVGDDLPPGRTTAAPPPHPVRRGAEARRATLHRSHRAPPLPSCGDLGYRTTPSPYRP